MAGSYTFHNKFHRANHHTLSSVDTVDAGLDPIASESAPFMGVFYNLLTDQRRSFNISTNSYEWWSTYTTFRAYSGTWMLTRSLYTTVSSLSDSWVEGYAAYLHIQSLSARYLALYTTVCSYSADWGSPYLMYTNRTQVYTHSKTFSGQNLYPIGTTGPDLSTYNWNLDTQQVAFLVLDKNVFINNPDENSKINGGMYTMVLKQNNPTVAPNGYSVELGTQYRLNDRNERSNFVNTALSGITIVNFICVDGLMYGDVTYLSGNF